jgi:hypothetical protein
MNAKEIREIPIDTSYGNDDATQSLLREIAAQLAELNKNILKVGNVIAIIGDRGDHR